MVLVLHDLFRASVHLAASGAAAVTFSDPEIEDLTYARLDALSKAVAAALTPVLFSDVRNGGLTTPLIGLCCPPSPGLAAGLLGVLNAGCAYVPLPTTAVETHRWLVSNVHLTGLLVHSDYLDLCLQHHLDQGEGWHVAGTVGPPELKLHLIRRATRGQQQDQERRAGAEGLQQRQQHQKAAPLLISMHQVAAACVGELRSIWGGAPHDLLHG